jgi:hypothetical protein
LKSRRSWNQRRRKRPRLNRKRNYAYISNYLFI